jgi:hypothetical protein
MRPQARVVALISAQYQPTVPNAHEIRTTAL